MSSRVFITFLLVFITFNALALSLDQQLRLIINEYDLKSETCSINKDLINERLTPIGEIVFNTPVLSGNKDTSCSTCHIENKHLTDGLSISIGVGGDGEGQLRMSSGGIIVPRNSFTLFGRASSHYQTFFWDGKVQEVNGKIYSPIGEGYALGFGSTLAVAAVLPILARDEFLGLQSLTQSNPNLNQINEVYYGEKLGAANNVLRQIVSAPKDENSKKLAQALLEAGVKEPDIQTIGNSLASFIAKRVQQCQPTHWDKYISGESSALTDKQKQGAVIFYGKGRCAGCHSGSLFTDFKFHSIGAPQGEFGPYIHRQDIGRANVTYRLEDRFRFRTPPLIHVTKTAPYGHNGEFKTIEEIVLFHINPIPYFAENGWTSKRELLQYGKILSTRSEMLGFIDISTKEEMDELLQFLLAL
ncbi:His-Xaa-Ser system-associated MauG-like protein [Hahella sp. CR1]|uniref:His-Xaa-Ser system-associated MauG-like protein n=1 Tax=Hahella sp. CR1 TaxID=2992807 RepID=UPI002441D2F4|nr:His-Xaa-Ser system-associated MauG-like protein [Hahella sp. CR1]MDG9670542.1 His-Xaa-Ser system-associated MauG-like protein [Hahella sp. CR1]